MAYPMFDRSQLQLRPLAERVHDFTRNEMLSPGDAQPAMASAALDAFVERVVAAHKRGAPLILMHGGHVVKQGLGRLVIDLMERGIVQHVAMNGSGPIHEYELALIGATTESVARYITEGQFGLWQETGRLNDVAVEAAHAFEFVGMPEGVYPLVEATLYLATAPKSNSATHYFKAQQTVMVQGAQEVPLHLRDTNRDGAKLGHGAGYVYPHEHAGHFAGQQYLPAALLGTYFYRPSAEGYEVAVSERLTRWRSAQRAALGITATSEPADLDEQQILKLKRQLGAG